MKLQLLNAFKTLLHGSIAISIILSVSVYTWARVLFYEVPFSLKEDFSILFKMTVLSWVIVICMKASYYLIGHVGEFLQKRFFPPAYSKWIGSLLVLIILSAFLFSCETRVSAGIKKDFTTGLTATYNNIEPEEVLLVMNDEVLNHNDIPIGEKFQLINKNVSGLVEKDGKVSVGCSLTITDKNGKKLLDAADLFKDNDVFNKKDASYLKCTVSTGEPMEWEENYDVVATFWDKYGTGKIVNKVTIRMIDIP